MFIRFVLIAALLDLLVLRAHVGDDLAHGALTRRGAQPARTRLLAVRLQLFNHTLLLSHRLGQSRDESLVVAHARDADAGARAPLEHALVFSQVTLQFKAASFRI